MRVVTNTSPLLYLFRLNRLDLLASLYGRIVVPQAVVDELAVGRHQGFDLPDCTTYAWMVLETVPVPAILRLVTGLGRGEAEALALALAQPTDLLLLDDAPAREHAALHSLRVTGTLGVLVQAKQQGLVDEVLPLVRELHAAGFRMSEKLMVSIVRMAGE